MERDVVVVVTGVVVEAAVQGVQEVRLQAPPAAAPAAAAAAGAAVFGASLVTATMAYVNSKNLLN